LKELISKDYAFWPQKLITSYLKNEMVGYLFHNAGESIKFAEQ